MNAITERCDLAARPPQAQIQGTDILTALIGEVPAVAVRLVDSATVTMSARAARRIVEIVAGEPDKPMLRISVEGGGCSGFQYRFDLTGERASDDVAIERDGAIVLVDQVSLEYLAGSEIDFVDDLIGASFKVTNPNAVVTCSCGESFAA